MTLPDRARRNEGDLVRVKSFAILGAALAATAFVPALAGAATTPSAPSLITTDFSCAGVVCTSGPGNVGSAYGATLLATGGPEYFGPECNPYTMSVVAGTLPPGLKVQEPDCDWEIIGTPTKAGTYDFTLQIAPQPNNLGQPAGPDGTEQLSVTIGTGSSDRLFATGASWVSEGGEGVIQLDGWDPNTAITYTLVVNGKANGTVTNNGGLVAAHGTTEPNPATVTLTDSLGTTVTVPVTVVKRKY